MLRATLRFCATSLAALALAGCSMLGLDGPSEEATLTNDEPVEIIYGRAETALRAGNERRAAKLFDEVERLYPTSQWAKRAIIMSAFSSYEAADYDKAVLSARRYIDFYPSDKDAAYAQYLIASSYYEQIVDVGRDQGTSKEALQALRELMNRYPDSDYAKEAELKIESVVDHLAGKEMTIGRYYLKRGYYVAAINRFRTVVTDYQTTSQVEEALHRLVECYLAMGVEREAQAVAAVLGHNFPASPWYADSFALLTGRDLRPEADDESWISETWRRVVKGEWL